MNVRLILSVLFLVMGCSSWVAAQAVRGNPQAGQMVYEKNCLRCHGEKLDGAGPEGEYLIVRLRTSSPSPRAQKPIGSLRSRSPTEQLSPPCMGSGGS